MEDNKLQKGIIEIKNIKMTDLEKKQVLDSVFSSPSNKDVHVRSPWVSYSFFAIFKQSHFAYYVIVPMFIILAGSGIVFASDASLPKSALYPIKIGIVEPVRAAFISSPESRARYESGLATERMEEAEILASKGKLDVETEKKLDNLLNNHTIALNKALDRVDQTESSDEVDEIAVKFYAGMNAHARVLESIKDKEGNKDLKRYDDIQISQTAREKAKDIKIVVVGKRDYSKKENDVVDYNKDKDYVPIMMIAPTASAPAFVGDITEVVATDEKDPETKDEILDEEDNVENFDQSEDESYEEDNYSELFDLESLAIEEMIFIETQINLENRGGRN